MPYPLNISLDVKQESTVIQNPSEYLDQKIGDYFKNKGIQYSPVINKKAKAPEKEKKGKAEKKYDYVYALIDYDNCYGHLEDKADPQKAFERNYAFYEEIKSEMLKATKGGGIASFSNRVNVKAELGACKGTSNVFHVPHYFYFYNQLKNAAAASERKDLKIERDYFSLEDIFYNEKDGMAFARSCQITDGAFLYPEPYRVLNLGATPVDHSKKLNAYAFIHRIAAKHPGEKILIDISDDLEKDILEAIHSFFIKYPDLVPPNVTLRFRYKDPGHPKGFILFPNIEGKITNKIDYNYKKNVLKLDECRSPDDEYRDQKVSDFIVHRQTQLEEESNSWVLILKNLINNLTLDIPTKKIGDLLKRLDLNKLTVKEVEGLIILVKAVHELNAFKFIPNSGQEKRIEKLENALALNQAFLQDKKDLNKSILTFKAATDTFSTLYLLIQKLLTQLEDQKNQSSVYQTLFQHFYNLSKTILNQLKNTSCSDFKEIQATYDQLFGYFSDLETNIQQQKKLPDEAQYKNINQELSILFLSQKSGSSRERAVVLVTLQQNECKNLAPVEKKLYEAIKAVFKTNEDKLTPSEYQTIKKILDVLIVDNDSEDNLRLCKDYSWSVIEKDIIFPYYQNISENSVFDRIIKDYQEATLQREKAKESKEEKFFEHANLKHLQAYYRSYAALKQHNLLYAVSDFVDFLYNKHLDCLEDLIQFFSDTREVLLGTKNTSEMNLDKLLPKIRGLLFNSYDLDGFNRYALEFKKIMKKSNPSYTISASTPASSATTEAPSVFAELMKNPVVKACLCGLLVASLFTATYFTLGAVLLVVGAWSGYMAFASSAVGASTLSGAGTSLSLVAGRIAYRSSTRNIHRRMDTTPTVMDDDPASSDSDLLLPKPSLVSPSPLPPSANSTRGRRRNPK